MHGDDPSTRRANQFQLTATPSTYTTRDIAPPSVGRQVRLTHHPQSLISERAIVSCSRNRFHEETPRKESQQVRYGPLPRSTMNQLPGYNARTSPAACDCGAPTYATVATPQPRRAWEAGARACCAVAHQPSNRDIIIRSRLRAFRPPGKLLMAQFEFEYCTGQYKAIPPFV